MKEKIKKILSKIRFSGLAFIIGFLGAYAGSEGTSLLWRRCLIPVIFAVCCLIETHSVFSILLMAIWGSLSIGYGVPGEGDEGSTLGSFWYKITKSSHFWTDVLTRGTVGLSIVTAFIIVPVLKQNWLVYIIGSLGIIFIYAFNSWRGYGEFKFKIKNKTYYLLKVDMVTYGVLGACGLLIIFK